MGLFGLNWGFDKPKVIEKDVQGNSYYEIFGGLSQISILTELEKMELVLTNPAALKTFAFNCDIFSVGKINRGVDIDWLRTKRATPNNTQDWTQFLWEYMFWLQHGTAYLWNPGGSKVLNQANPIMWLNPCMIEWPSATINATMDLSISQASQQQILSNIIRYHLGNGKVKEIPLSEITPFFDLSSNLEGNQYVGASRLDALVKVISNNNANLNAKGQNLDFASKFLVSGKHNPTDVATLPMSELEKNNIERTIGGGKSIHAVKTMVDIQRFSSDIANLRLDEQYFTDYKIISSAYGIPSDLSETSSNKGSTYVNINKAMQRHSEFWLEPKGQQLVNGIANLFSYDDLIMSWRHLSFAREGDLEAAEVTKLRLENIAAARALGIKIDETNLKF